MIVERIIEACFAACMVMAVLILAETCASSGLLLWAALH